MNSFKALVALVLAGGLAVGVLAAVVAVPPPAIGAPPAAAANPAGLAGGQAHGAGVAQRGGSQADHRPDGAGQPAGRAPTTGTIERVDAARLAVRTATGVLEVVLADTTTYQRLTKTSPADLKVGENLVARGEAVGDTLVARSVQVTAAADAAHAGSSGSGWRGGQDGQHPDDVSAGRGGGAVFGRVERVEGTTVTVATPAGSRVLSVAADAEVRRVTGATRADLKVGQTVTMARAGGPDAPAAGVTISEA